MNKLTSVGVLPLVAQLICGVGDGHGQERGTPTGAEEERAQQLSRHPCPVNLALRKDETGCQCGAEVLQGRHFRTLTLLRSQTQFVLVCKDNERIGILHPALVR